MLDEVKSTGSTSFLKVKPQDPVSRGNGLQNFIGYATCALPRSRAAR
jgi:hypothetical protein